MRVVTAELAILSGLSVIGTRRWPTWAEVRHDPFAYARHLAHQKRYYRRRRPLGFCACGRERYHGNSKFCAPCRREHRKKLARDRQRRYRERKRKAHA